jgi:hypothetical protein
MKAFLMMLPIFMLAIPVLSGPIENLKPGEWYEVPNSHMSAMDPCPARTCGYSGSGGQQSVMAAWGSGAYDTKRDRLIVWGGGHVDYHGNEVYVFDLNTLQWQRLTNPSDPAAVDAPYASDGGPCARHTYNYIQYVPSIDRFCSFGGAGFSGSGNSGTDNVDAFNFTTNQWEKKGAMPGVGNHIASISAVDGATGKVWVHGTYDNSKMAEWDPVTNTWTSRGLSNASGYMDIRFTAAIDPKREKMVAVGGGAVWVWDLLAAGNTPVTAVTTTGPQDMVTTDYCGLQYDPVSDKIVAWKGGSSVYTLDMDTKVWQKIAPVGTNTVTPTASAQAGTNGRFRYVPSKNVFVVVNSTNEDVFIYRLTAGTGIERAADRVFNAGLQVSPNPFGSATSIRAGGALSGRNCHLEIYDQLGRLIRTADLRPNTAMHWDASDLAAGVYLLKASAGNSFAQRKLMLLR